MATGQSDIKLSCVDGLSFHDFQTWLARFWFAKTAQPMMCEALWRSRQMNASLLHRLGGRAC